MVRSKTMELDAAFPSWVAAERALEVLADASAERDAKYTTAEYLAAALAEDYLTAERALRTARLSAGVEGERVEP